MLLEGGRLTDTMLARTIYMHPTPRIQNSLNWSQFLDFGPYLTTLSQDLPLTLVVIPIQPFQIIYFAILMKTWLILALPEFCGLFFCTIGPLK